MPKKPGNGPKSVEKTLQNIVSDIVFMPESSMIPVKIKFWHKFSQVALADPDNVTREMAAQYSNDNRVTRWWSRPGFKEWFLNEDEFKQNLEELAYKALGALNDILMDPDAQAGARVNAAKLVLEAASKMPKKYEKESYKDEKIQEMTKEQLDEYISKRALKSGGEDAS